MRSSRAFGGSSCLVSAAWVVGLAACSRGTSPTDGTGTATPAPAAKAETSVPVRAPGQGPSWVNIGMEDGAPAWSTKLPSPDTGAVRAIRVDPRDPRVVYMSTGAGLFRCDDVTMSSPGWRSLTDSLPLLGGVAMDLDPSAPDTLYLGTGEGHAYSEYSNGVVVKSQDRGRSFGAPVPLVGRAGGKRIEAGSVQELRVDPTNAKIVMAGTSHGLFRSTDAGDHWTLIDLPNAGTPVEESVTGIVYLGAKSGVSEWLATGLEPCKSAPVSKEDWEHEAPRPACGAGQVGDIWRSSDAGATWTSLRAAGAFPLHEQDGQVAGMTFAAGGTRDPRTTVVFGMAASQGHPKTSTIDFLRSTDGGRTFRSARGVLADPKDHCPLDVGGSQSGYNQAVAVDPRDAAHVLIGGEGCALRSRNALDETPRWEGVSRGGASNTSSKRGDPGYVHSDWHTAIALLKEPVTRVLVGTDGGPFFSDDVFVASKPHDVTWHAAGRGAKNQFHYSLGSGDAADENEGMLITGLQDLGTRIRDPVQPGRFLVVGPGDGSASVVYKTKEGSLYAFHYEGLEVRSCVARASTDCHGGPVWKTTKIVPPPGDKSKTPGGRFVAVPTDPEGAMLAVTKRNVFRGDAQAQFHAITGTYVDAADATRASRPGAFPVDLSGVDASATIAGFYGVALEDGRCAITTNGAAPEPEWTISTKPKEHAGPASSVAFPPPLPGQRPGDAYVCAHNLGYGQKASASGPHLLFATKDRGKTWHSLHGEGADALPFVGVRVVRYDPSDVKGLTIYAGTDVGVFLTVDGGVHWVHFGRELPEVRVEELLVSRRGDLVRIATWGRGIWEIHVSK